MPRSTIREPARRLPVSGACDVLVAGGGMAGVAAAVAAARAGASVCLLEKACALGGLATLGNVVMWLPLCDGRGRQVSGGLAEELLKLSVADLSRDHPAARLSRIPACWQPGAPRAARREQRYRTGFNPFSYQLALEALVVRSGVRLLYDTRVCAVSRAGARLRHVVIENKSGRSAIACGAAVDATGDADVCFLAGEHTESLATNVLAGWYYRLDGAGLTLECLSNTYHPRAARAGAEGPFFRGDSADDVTAHLLGTRSLIRARMAAYRRGHPDADSQLVAPPALACLRMTRRLVGPFSLGARHAHTWFDDTVGLTGDWRKPGPVYAIPFRALRAGRIRNLAAAGRCLSADRTAWDVTRAIPGCVVSGQAAGAAAALAVQRARGDLTRLKVADVQRHLADQGALLDPQLVQPGAA